MAVRLPLILSQPARREATATELIENIVAASLMLPKIDSNLIGDISTIEPGSTDHLCLQGHTRDVILASFLDMPTAEAGWQRLGQTGQFIDCSQNTEAIRRSATGTQQRRVFYFQLSYHLKVPRLLDQCQELVAAQAVQLVSIQLGAGQSSAGALPIMAKPSSASANGHLHAHAQQPPTPKVHSPLPMNSHASKPAVNSRDADDEDWSSIDKLVDELDAMDI